MSTPIAIAVVEHEGCFLIGQRPAGASLAGLWEFPGGKIEPGETAEAAAIRECLEETGLRVQPLSRYPLHVQEYDHDRVELHFIACRMNETGPFTPRLPFRWIARSELSRYEFPAGNRGILQLLLAGNIAVHGPGPIDPLE
jgi:8-oxo-dGTP diphosphatase